MNLGLLILAALLVLGGAGLVFASLVGSQTQRRAISRRVAMVAAPDVAKPRTTRSAISVWMAKSNALLEAIFSFRREHSWGTVTQAPVLLVIGVGAGGVAWLITHTVFHLPAWLTVPLSAIAFLVAPHMKLSMEQRGADARFTDRFPDAIDSMIRMLRAGLPISAAIRAVAAEPSPPVDAVFRSLADQMDIGVPLETALAAAGKRVNLADFRFFTVAVSLQHTTGGNLTTTLDILSEIIRKRRAMRLKASAVTAEVRMTSYILAAIPLIIVGGLLVINPGYLSPMIHDPRGNLIVAAAVGSLTMGFLTMRQMMHHATRL